MATGADNSHQASPDTGPYDVAVVGAGLVGASAALTLGRNGFRVALIDRQRPRQSAGELGFDIRSVALSRSSLDLIGIDVPASPIGEMCVWEEHGGGRLTFNAKEAQVEALAWMVESSRVCVALADACDGMANVDWIEDTVAGVDCSNTEVVLEFPNGSVSARLLVAADGVDSKVRALAGVDLVDRSADDAAIATVVRTAGPHRDVAYQRFSADGPLAFLPLPDPACCAVIWSTNRKTTAELAALDDAAFATALDAAFEHALGRIVAIDQRFTFPLPQRIVRDFNPTPRILFVGDAAHTLHPLAGQGVNLGLEDVAGIAEEAVRDPTDLGRTGRWRGFALRRRARAEVMIGVMRALRGGYAYGGPVGRWIRNSGVRMVDAAPAIKRQLVREAMGIGVLARFA